MSKKQAINPLEVRPGYQLRRASLALTGALTQALDPLGLTAAESAIMLSLSAQPGQTQSGLGRVLGIHRANMTPVIARLEARGLIDRVDVDRRSHGLVLTAEGAALSAQADRVTSQTDKNFFINDVDPEELKRRLSALWRP